MTHPSQTLRLASYNIRKSVGLDWKRDPQRIQNVLAEMNADIVLLQEADKRIGSRKGTLSESWLHETLGYRFADVSIREKSHGWHGNVILFRDSATLLATHRIDLPSLEPRGAVAAVFQWSENCQLQIIGTHLSLLKSVRNKQYRALEQFVQQNQHQYPTVIGGDFNERRVGSSLDGAFGQSLEIVTPGPSFHSARPWFSFDRFVVSENVSLQHCFVHNSQLSRRASDHLPICLDVKIEKGPTTVAMRD